MNFTQEEISSHSSALTFKYKTRSPYNFLTIVPVIYEKKTQTTFHKAMPKYIPIELKDGQLYSAASYFLGEVALLIEKHVDIHDSEYIILLVVGSIAGICLLTIFIGGVWLGGKYCQKTRTVYIMREINQEENAPEEEEGSMA